MEMNKVRKYLYQPAMIFIALWVLSTLFTKCGDTQISCDIVNATDKTASVLKNAAKESRDYNFPEFPSYLVEEIEEDTTYPNQKHYLFFLKKSHVFLTITYIEDSRFLSFSSIREDLFRYEDIVTFQHSKVSAITILKAINEFKSDVLQANGIEYSENWFNYISIYMAFFDDYQDYVLLLIILLMFFYINYNEAIRYEQYKRENADEQE
jgi:hypothetical protein